MGSLITKLAKLGPETDKSTLDEILARREEAIPYLAKVATEEEYWEMEHGKDYSIWAPISAIHLLSVIGGKAAEGAIEQAIRKYYEDTEDWLTEDMPSVLASLGPNAFDMLAGMVKERELDEWVRDGAARALLMVSRKHPEVRERAVQLLRDAIASEQDMNARTLLLDVLIEFKDKESLPFVKSFFDRNMVDTFDLPYSEVLNVYAGEYDHLEHDIAKDPMGIFEEKGNFYRETNCTIDEQIRRSREDDLRYDDYLDAISAPLAEDDNYEQAEIKKRNKIGRNEPCPCGSGKKYKRCCMKNVRISV
ncbi:MAG: DUF1186 domain-containing protein [Nitrososphaerales archaeon]